jgi:hypothetical protein
VQVRKTGGEEFEIGDLKFERGIGKVSGNRDQVSGGRN